jgi:hypothetical protein
VQVALLCRSLLTTRGMCGLQQVSTQKHSLGAQGLLMGCLGFLQGPILHRRPTGAKPARHPYSACMAFASSNRGDVACLWHTSMLCLPAVHRSSLGQSWQYGSYTEAQH